MNTTNNLLNKLNRDVRSRKQLSEYITSIDEYSDITFDSYFLSLLKEKELKKSAVIKESGIPRTYGYQLLNGTKKPGRDYAIILCITAHLTLEETTRCLEILGEGILYSKNVRDAIIIYAINHRMTLMEINELLYEKKEAVLG